MSSIINKRRYKSKNKSRTKNIRRRNNKRKTLRRTNKRKSLRRTNKRRQSKKLHSKNKRSLRKYRRVGGAPSDSEDFFQWFQEKN